MSERARAIAAAVALLAMVACSPTTSRYRWDMSRDVGMDSRWALKSERLVVKGLTERDVRSLWGRPHDTVRMPPAYRSLLYETRDAWITVVLYYGRVDRVETITRSAGTPQSAQTPVSSQSP
jgi:hypothetical protein